MGDLVYIILDENLTLKFTQH